MKFYRAQSDRSFTEYTANQFQSRGSYFVHNSHWLNKGKIERHLAWNDRSVQPTPFISVFDNLRKAQNPLSEPETHSNHSRCAKAGAVFGRT